MSSEKTLNNPLSTIPVTRAFLSDLATNLEEIASKIHGEKCKKHLPATDKKHLHDKLLKLSEEVRKKCEKFQTNETKSTQNSVRSNAVVQSRPAKLTTEPRAEECPNRLSEARKTTEIDGVLVQSRLASSDIQESAVVQSRPATPSRGALEEVFQNRPSSAKCTATLQTLKNQTIKNKRSLCDQVTAVATDIDGVLVQSRLASSDVPESAVVQSRPATPIRGAVKEVDQNRPSLAECTVIRNQTSSNEPIQREPSLCDQKSLAAANRSATSGTTDYYKSLEIKSDKFHKTNSFPSFNPGRKPVKPSDTSALENTCVIEVEKPEDYIKIKELLIESRELNEGEMNIDGIDCTRNGKVSIRCEDEQSKNKAFKLLKREGFEIRSTNIKEFAFVIFGVPKILKSEEITEHLQKRDSRFKNNPSFKILARFPINKAKDALAFEVDLKTTKMIMEKKHLHIKEKKYKIEEFIELVQCYRCSKFGHRSTECKESKPSCPNCAEEHELKNCTTFYEPKCSNCNSVKVEEINHSSFDIRCPFRLNWIGVQKKNLRFNG